MYNNLTLEEKSSLLDQLILNQYECVSSIDLDTGKATTVYATDPDWKRTLGSSFVFEDTIKQYLADKSADVEIGKLYREMSLPQIVKKIERDNSCHVNFTVRNKRGRLILKRADFITKDKRSVWFLCSDVTDEYHEANERMEQLRHALRDANNQITEKNAFLKLMSQNIRSPLYSIMGLTRIAQDTKDGSLDTYLHKISMSGTYMTETIDDILDLRRIANHEVVLHPEPIRMNEFLATINGMLQPVVDDRELVFTLNAENLTNLRVKADPHAMQQILTKMVRSAIGYTVKGSRINLNVRELFRSTDKVTLEFSVECLGIVIDQERLKVLFQPYDYLQSIIEEDARSIDIALVILKSYALAMGADTLTAESDEGKGTKLSISLTVPFMEEDSIVSAPRDEVTRDFSGLRVLIVDDNEINLEVGEKLLFNKGCDVVSARNGQDAINCYVQDEGKYDLIIMDIVMPVMDGLEAAKQIRQMDIPGSGTVPIIAMTADAFKDNFEESFQAGMNAHLVKPISPERLYSVMSDVLERK